MNASLGAALQAGIDRHRAGDLTGAEAIYRHVLAQHPNHADALHLAGLVAIVKGCYAEAIDLMTKAVAQRPGEAAFHSNLGEAYRRLGQFGEALASLNRALELQPNLPEAHLNLAETLCDAGRLDEAIASAQQAITLRSRFAQALNCLGRAYAQKGRRDDAIACYRRAVECDSNFPEALCNLGGALVEAEAWDDAIASLQQALTLRPAYATAFCSLGVAWRGKGDFGQAARCYRQAIALSPDSAFAHWNLATLLLMLGQFEEGWKEFEWRLRGSFFTSPRRPFTAPRWDGSPAPGETILIHAEQGFGDAIQFMRYVPLVQQRAQAARVVVECPRELTRLLGHNDGWTAEVVARDGWDGGALPPFDRHLHMLSLPWVLRCFEPLPMRAAYLRADDELRAAWRERLPAGFRVGLAWAGTATHTDDARRSLEVGKLTPLLRVAGVVFISLQVKSSAQAPGVCDWTEHIRDFADTAALIAELDLVIAVDTAVVHLAGALGRPVWTLLAALPDWRWGLEREDTPWYPTMRLFRQQTAGDWDEVMARVAVELEAARR